MNKTVWLLLFAFVVCVSTQEYNVKCVDNLNKSLTFEPSNDGVEGRYKIEWCTHVNINMTSWQIILRFYNNKTFESCKQFRLGQPLGVRHSHKDVKVELNCTNVCLSTYLDLIFNATCYHVNTGLKSLPYSSATVDALFYVKNPYPMTRFNNSQIHVSYESSDDKELVIWYLGYVPATSDTVVELCIPDNYTKVETCESMENNCTTVGVRRTEVRCEFVAPTDCYRLRLKHYSPWSRSDIFRRVNNAFYDICAIGPSRPTVDPPVKNNLGGAIRWAGAAVAITVAALLLLLFARMRYASKLEAKIRLLWPIRNPPEPPPKPVIEGRRVLLIYARDCKPFMNIVQELKGMLQQTGCHVVDIFSSEVVAASASAPGEWLRRLATDPATRLLLLQSPAAAALYSSQLITQGEPHLSAPLLGRVAVRRLPHPADGTAMLALRMIGEAAHQPLAYRKCYVATIEGLDVELVPGVTPHRRYVLPTYTEVLLRDLTPGSNAAELHNVQSAPDAGVQAQVPYYTEATNILAAAVDNLIDFIQDNPDYLTDELLFI